MSYNTKTSVSHTVQPAFFDAFLWIQTRLYDVVCSRGKWDFALRSIKINGKKKKTLIDI